jgi:hypothetical protein
MILKRKKKLLIEGIILILFGIVLYIFVVTNDKINSDNDLIKIKAKLDNYSSIEYGSYLHRVDAYQLSLKGYNNNFIIISDFFKYFDKPLFEKSMTSGDSIMLEIYNQDFKNLSNQKDIWIYGLSDNDIRYLKTSDSINEHNNPIYIFFVVFSIIAGVILLIIYFDK